MSIDKEDFKMKIKTDNYVCSICGKRNVKLWRPYMDITPLICAECAEERQSSREYEEKIWSKEGEARFSGIFTGRRQPLPKWKVNEKGKIPTDMGPVPEGMTMIPMTDQLLVNMSDVSAAYSSGRTSMIPACPDEDGNFWGYTSVPEENCKWWEELPTR